MSLPYQPTGALLSGLLKPVNRPPGACYLTPARSEHILYGYRRGGSSLRGGGHLFGSPDPRKTKFPQGWDEAKILAAVVAVANDPSLPCYEQVNGNIRIYGEYDGLLIRVAFSPISLEIVTGFPETP